MLATIYDSQTNATDRVRPRTHPSVDVAIASSFDVRVTNESSESTPIETEQLPGCGTPFQQIIGNRFPRERPCPMCNHIFDQAP